MTEEIETLTVGSLTDEDWSALIDRLAERGRPATADVFRHALIARLLHGRLSVILPPGWATLARRVSEKDVLAVAPFALSAVQCVTADAAREMEVWASRRFAIEVEKGCGDCTNIAAEVVMRLHESLPEPVRRLEVEA